jgi:hypothetical protein
MLSTTTPRPIRRCSSASLLALEQNPKLGRRAAHLFRRAQPAHLVRGRALHAGARSRRSPRAAPARPGQYRSIERTGYLTGCPARAARVEKVGPLDERYHYAEDADGACARRAGFARCSCRPRACGTR